MIQLQPLLQAPLTALWHAEIGQPFTQGRGYAHPQALKERAVLFLGLATSYNQTHNVAGDPAAPLVFDIYDSPGAFYRKEADFLAATLPRVPYAHLDVLYQRESDPKLLQEALYGAGAAFGEAQLGITQQVLAHLTGLPAAERPRAIVCANRLAQELLGFFASPARPAAREWLQLTFAEQEVAPHEEPYYLCAEWGAVPVLFTTPFSGLTARFNTLAKRTEKHARLAATLQQLLG